MGHLAVKIAGRARIGPIGGSIRDAVERPVRWTKLRRWHFSFTVAGAFLVGLLVLNGAILVSLRAMIIVTVLRRAIDDSLHVRHWTAGLAKPAVFVFIPLIRCRLARRTIVNGDWRYHMRASSM